MSVHEETQTSVCNICQCSVYAPHAGMLKQSWNVQHVQTSSNASPSERNFLRLTHKSSRTCTIVLSKYPSLVNYFYFVICTGEVLACGAAVVLMVCVCVWVWRRAVCFMFRQITLDNPSIMEVNGEWSEHSSSLLLPIIQLPSVCSAFTPLILQCCLFYFTLYFFFVSCFHSLHQSQSLDQVTLTNATILDGSGGGPNGSLADSMGSVAVCLPSEPSLTDSLHTSAVSLPRNDGSM